MRYGVPYKGSKNSIAEWVVANLPNAECFVDLFLGGCRDACGTTLPKVEAIHYQRY